MALTRRDFLGASAVVASASLGKFAVPLALALPASSEQGEWIRGGLVDAGGTHEPYIFVVRCGGQRLDTQKISDYEQSEGLIKQLHDQGVDVFHTHLYKGFGMVAEEVGMEETRKAIAIAHRYGMKADTYIQWDSMMYETFFAEEPRAPSWIQRDVAGLPILWPYGGYQQSFRYRPCFSNQEYLDYLKKVVRYAVVEAKTDFIHFDNFELNREPDSCHCEMCTTNFRKFLRTKYSDERRRERFGFVNTDFVNMPLWNRDYPPGDLDIISEPLFQESIDFRCQLMADALQQISEYIKSLNPDVVVEINPGGINGDNRPWVTAVDHARLLKFTEAFWSEEDDPPAYHADGRLISRIRSYKLARTYSNTLITYSANNPVALAESLAFNQTLGFVGYNPLSPKTLEYIEFYRRNMKSYESSEDVANVAVLRSYASLTYHNSAAQLSAILAEQALIQSGIPFALIFDEHLQDLFKYNVLILPNAECLSDAQLSLIRRYVNEGGGLIVTERSGLYDEWRRVRTEPGLRGLVDSQSRGPDDQELLQELMNSQALGSSQEELSKTIRPAAVTRKLVGHGRVAYIPALPFDGILPSHEPYFAISNIFWKRPKNWRDLIDAIRWAGGNQIPLTLDGPEFLVANCTSQTWNQRFFVHMVNYNATRIPVLAKIHVQAALPKNKKASKVTLYAPASSAGRQLDFANDSTSVKFIVPEIRTYALIAVQW